MILQDLWRPLLGFLTAFILTIALMPLVIFLSKKLKARQTILHYVDNHKGKSGTPTMGGIGFIIAIVVSAILGTLGGNNSLTILAVLVMVGYGVVGFLDDFLKIVFKKNKGLSAWQKIVFQLAIAVVVSLFAYFNQNVGGMVFIPFTLSRVSFSWLAVPFFMIIFLAFTNAVNLTDGLDGLAGKVTLVYILFNGLLVLVTASVLGDNPVLQREYSNLVVFALAIVGALLGFLCFNGYPAKVFMGDTGSLALGGAVGAFAVVSGLSLYSPLVGIMFVLTALSVILQVGYFKATKGKRIFLMSPLHHHFERKGIHENRISTVYTAITAAIGSLALMLTILIAL